MKATKFAKAFSVHIAGIFSIIFPGWAIGYVLNIPNFTVIWTAAFALSLAVGNSPKIRRLYEEARSNNGQTP